MKRTAWRKLLAFGLALSLLFSFSLPVTVRADEFSTLKPAEMKEAKNHLIKLNTYNTIRFPVEPSQDQTHLFYFYSPGDIKLSYSISVFHDAIDYWPSDIYLYNSQGVLLQKLNGIEWVDESGGEYDSLIYTFNFKSGRKFPKGGYYLKTIGYYDRPEDADYTEYDIMLTPRIALESKITSIKKANTAGTVVNVTWKATPGAVKYNIYRSATPSGGFTKIKEVAGTANTCRLKRVPNGRYYYYKVIAYRRVSGKLYFTDASYQTAVKAVYLKQ